MKKIGRKLSLLIAVGSALMTTVILASCLYSQSTPLLTKATPTSDSNPTVESIDKAGLLPPQQVDPLPTEAKEEPPENNMHKDDEANQKISQGVIEAIQKNGEANIVIMLVPPSSLQTSPVDLPTVRNEIARLQDDVLSVLDDSDYRQKHKYETIPALAGTLLTEAGLAKLATHPKVVRVDLDVGGSGGQ